MDTAAGGCAGTTVQYIRKSKYNLDHGRDSIQGRVREASPRHYHIRARQNASAIRCTIADSVKLTTTLEWLCRWAHPAKRIAKLVIRGPHHRRAVRLRGVVGLIQQMPDVAVLSIWGVGLGRIGCVCVKDGIACCAGPRE